MILFLFFFFFKQKTAYEMRISDWSSDVCSSDLTEMSDEYKMAQAELVSSHIAKQDIVITTALIPGRPAPRLISDAQVATMKPGSVIVEIGRASCRERVCQYV